MILKAYARSFSIVAHALPISELLSGLMVHYLLIFTKMKNSVDSDQLAL